ncbi:MAG TPA: endolytic transglycosylase MltG [Allosphingosinicella sp.]|nr:endolytic transglycosylase MltG [Allosphingosinicella sp.]
MKRLVLIALALGALLAGWAYWSMWVGSGPSGEAKTIVVEQGASVADVAEQLSRQGLIRTGPATYRRLARFLGSPDPIQAGEFEIPARASGAAILDILQHGRPLQRLVTVPEGMPSVLVHERLMAAPFLTGPVAVPEEGSVLPNSYAYQRGETRAAVLARMQRAMREELARLWARRSPHTVVTTPQEAVTLASIVEKETAKASERRMVAGVYSNRLRRGMKLDADPTIIYPITRGRPLGRPIRRSEIDAVNGYNTYTRAGLPVGPIANPGRESIAAVLNPSQTQALYFVADGTGGHIFANTLEEHNRNHQRWRQIREERLRRQQQPQPAR